MIITIIFIKDTSFNHMLSSWLIWKENLQKANNKKEIIRKITESKYLINEKPLKDTNRSAVFTDVNRSWEYKDISSLDSDHQELELFKSTLILNFEDLTSQKIIKSDKS